MPVYFLKFIAKNPPPVPVKELRLKPVRIFDWMMILKFGIV